MMTIIADAAMDSYILGRISGMVVIALVTCLVVYFLTRRKQ